MGLEQVAVPVFAGHQTFHPRFGWLKKGFDGASANAGIFSCEDATVQLGVGKNMVEAIRHWCVATKVLIRVADPRRTRHSLYVPTSLGHLLFSDDGFDPYFEDPTTLWIMHWMLCTPPRAQPVWWLAFNSFRPIQFDEETLLAFCRAQVEATSWSHPHSSSIAKDVDCLLRQYTTRAARGRQTLDDLLDSPFRELGLISAEPGRSVQYRFAVGPKPSLTATAVAFACLDYAATHLADARSVTVSQLVSEDSSPGRIFRLSEADVASALAVSAQGVAGLQLTSPTGSTQLVFDGHPNELALSLLASHVAAQGRNLDGLALGTVVGPQARSALNQPVGVF